LSTFIFFFLISTLLTNFSHFRWKIKGRVERISRLFPIKNYNKNVFFGLRDQSGIIRIKAFGKQAQKNFNVIEKGQFYTLQYARVDEAISVDHIFPLIHEIVIAEIRKNAGNLNKFKQIYKKAQPNLTKLLPDKKSGHKTSFSRNEHG
jgi:hypothetical protein